jgi:hypothetical protein
MKKDPLRLFFFVDGYTLKKVNEFYRFHHPFHSRLDFRALKNWARQEALRTFAPGSNYALMDCHYYHPYKDPKQYGGTWGFSCFERELRFAGFQIHYCDQVGPEGVRPNMSLLEDALLFASYRKMDAVVLLSTQGQYAPLPERLQLMGLPTLLLGWQFTYEKENRFVRWRTDPYLQEVSTYYVAMDRVAERGFCAADGGLFSVR